MKDPLTAQKTKERYKTTSSDEFEQMLVKAGKLDIWDIRIFHGGYIRRLIKNRMPEHSCDYAREGVFEIVVSEAEKRVKKGKFEATHGIKSIRAYLKRIVNARCTNYCKSHDPETGLKLLREYWGKERDKAKRRKQREHMDKTDTIYAFESLGIDFQKEVLHKRVFLLHMEGMARSEIAKATRLSVSQVKKALETTLRKLRKHPTALFANEVWTERRGGKREKKPTKEQAWKSILRENIEKKRLDMGGADEWIDQIDSLK